MSDSRFDICIDWDGQTLEVGKLYANDRSAAVTFEYSEEWLNRHHSFAIDPDGLPLGRGRFAIAKLSKPDDVRDIAMGEILAMAVARAAGIRTADHQLENVGGRGVAIIQRFDRENGRRIPFISAWTLLGLPREERGSYTILADAIRAHGENVAVDLSELFRRLVYSILVGNLDDHLRNHDFLMRTAGLWSLSPAYDINPAPMIDRFHGREPPVSEDSPDDHEIAAELDHALGRANRFGLNLPTARTVVAEVRAAMAQWRSIGKRAGISDSAISAYADAFEAP